MQLHRLITIPSYILLWFAWLIATPLWALSALVVDAVLRRGGVALRSGVLVAVYLTCEVAGILASGGLWLWKSVAGIDDETWADLHLNLEAWWGTTLFHSIVKLFGLQIEVTGDARLADGPYLLLLRHSSTADTLISSALVSTRYGTRLRYVLKSELLWDPCLDIVGQRTPNVFVDRSSDDSDHQVERIKQLAHGLGKRDGVLIYPEGTRFSRKKRARVIEGFQERGDMRMRDYAESLEFVLPPRMGGTLGLLEAAPDADVVICSHTGFEGASSLARIWHGDLVHRPIRVDFRRVPRSRIPAERAAQIDWLLEEWQEVGRWVARNRYGA